MDQQSAKFSEQFIIRPATRAYSANLKKNYQQKLFVGKETVGYSDDEDVYAVLEEDGTEVDEEEYFQLLPARTRLIVMSSKEIWSPLDTLDSMQG